LRTRRSQERETNNNNAKHVTTIVGQVGNLVGNLPPIVNRTVLGSFTGRADYQSAAGCHPAPQTKACNRLNKIVAVRNERKL
jgi:hypothetical protein